MSDNLGLPKKMKNFSIYQYMILLKLKDENDQETYNIFKEEFAKVGFREVFYGVFLGTSKDNDVVNLMISFQALKDSYQGISESIEDCKALTLANISDMKIFFEK